MRSKKFIQYFETSAKKSDLKVFTMKMVMLNVKNSDIRDFGKQGVKVLSFPHIATSAKNSNLGFLDVKDFGMEDSSFLSCRLFAQCVQTLMEGKQKERGQPHLSPWMG